MCSQKMVLANLVEKVIAEIKEEKIEERSDRT
jgi:hypothetical protein